MKKKLILVGLLSFAILLGYFYENDRVEADIKDGFSIKAKGSVKNTRFYKMKDIDTECYYLLTEPKSSNTALSIVIQMMIEKDGVTVPYCEN